MAATQGSGKRADLVLEGGGVKGIALVGALAVLEERGYGFPRVAGTSAGAIVGALAAARMPTTKMVEVMEQLDYRRFQDARGLARLGPLGRGAALATTSGVYRGDYLRSWLAEQLSDHGVRTFAQLRGDDPNTSLPAAEDYRLVVMVSDVTRGELRRLPWEYDRYGCEADEMRVVDAVRASMSIPFFSRPVKLTDRRDAMTCWLVDGGMLSNFPVDCFDRRDDRRPRWPTFGIKLSDRPKPDGAAFKVRGPVSMTFAMVGTMTSFYDRIHLHAQDVTDRTIFIDTRGVRPTNFKLDKDTQRRLYENGLKAAERFLDGGDGREPWDFEAYLQRHRGFAAPTAATHTLTRSTRGGPGRPVLRPLDPRRRVIGLRPAQQAHLDFDVGDLGQGEQRVLHGRTRGPASSTYAGLGGVATLRAGITHRNHREDNRMARDGRLIRARAALVDGGMCPLTRAISAVDGATRGRTLRVSAQIGVRRHVECVASGQCSVACPLSRRASLVTAGCEARDSSSRVPIPSWGPQARGRPDGRTSEPLLDASLGTAPRMGWSSGAIATTPLEGGRRRPGDDIPAVGAPSLPG